MPWCPEVIHNTISPWPQCTPIPYNYRLHYNTKHTFKPVRHYANKIQTLKNRDNIKLIRRHSIPQNFRRSFRDTWPNSAIRGADNPWQKCIYMVYFWYINNLLTDRYLLSIWLLKKVEARSHFHSLNYQWIRIARSFNNGAREWRDNGWLPLSVVISY